MAVIKKFIDRKELLRRELIAALVVTNTVFLLAVLLPVSLLADTTFTEMVPAPWIFAGIQLLLKYLPPLWAGIILPFGTAAFLISFPYLTKIWPVLTKASLWVIVTIIIIVTIVGHFIVF
ncbi:MAG: hypothetical protein PWQ96_531 [Clostridia bacterium]|jgi:hypothetical protein|nr:hypothetical protein [Clostridiales bacterium]MDK2984889.1 hypothetical protein [Clostridia bacterium]